MSNAKKNSAQNMYDADPFSIFCDIIYFLFTYRVGRVVDYKLYSVFRILLWGYSYAIVTSY